MHAWKHFERAWAWTGLAFLLVLGCSQAPSGVGDICHPSQNVDERALFQKMGGLSTKDLATLIYNEDCSILTHKAAQTELRLRPAKDIESLFSDTSIPARQHMRLLESLNLESSDNILPKLCEDVKASLANVSDRVKALELCLQIEVCDCCEDASGMLVAPISNNPEELKLSMLACDEFIEHKQPLDVFDLFGKKPFEPLVAHIEQTTPDDFHSALLALENPGLILDFRKKISTFGGLAVAAQYLTNERDALRTAWMFFSKHEVVLPFTLMDALASKQSPEQHLESLRALTVERQRHAEGDHPELWERFLAFRRASNRIWLEGLLRALAPETHWNPYEYDKAESQWRDLDADLLVSGDEVELTASTRRCDLACMNSIAKTEGYKSYEEYALSQCPGSEKTDDKRPSVLPVYETTKCCKAESQKIHPNEQFWNLVEWRHPWTKSVFLDSKRSQAQLPSVACPPKP